MFDKMSSLEKKYDEEILYLKRKLNEQDVKYFEEISLLKAQIQQTSLGGNLLLLYAGLHLGGGGGGASALVCIINIQEVNLLAYQLRHRS